MRHAIQATVLLVALAVGAAHAQTATGTNATPPSTTTPMTAPMTGPMTPVRPMGTTPMNTPSMGMTSAPPSTSPAPAAVSSANNPRTTAAPVAGANSFTAGQAAGRMHDKGFTDVTGLKKDNRGVWRGMAMKEGKSVPVAMDYQGNVVSQ